MSFMSLLRIIHVAAGALALLVVAVPLVARKGGRAHRRVGQVFAFAMGVVSVTAVPLCIARLTTDLRAGMFLLQITVLSGASVYLGLRALKAKVPGVWRRERGLSAALLAFSVAVIAFGAAQRSGLFLGFGALGVAQGWQWSKFWSNPQRESGAWFLMHMNGMGTCAIAAVTAFAVINARALGIPSDYRWIAWVAPGVLGGAGLTAWQLYYRRRFTARTSSTPA